MIACNNDDSSNHETICNQSECAGTAIALPLAVGFMAAALAK